MADLISYPIIFSAPMVRAILREIETPGTGKWQTRRLAEKQVVTYPGCPKSWGLGEHRGDGYTYLPTVWQKRYERWQAGERPWLWVKETWRTHTMFDAVRPSDLTTRSIHYEADGRLERSGKCRQSIHMPKRLSRLSLRVTDMRMEKLQDISGADAVAEGCNAIGHDGEVQHVGGHPSYSISEFSRLWNSIHGPGAWAKNPEVVVVQFIPQLANIGSIAHG